MASTGRIEPDVLECAGRQQRRLVMEWFEVVEVVKHHVVQISTPRGHGTGFFVWASQATDFCAIATAAHVVNDSSWWEEPIRLLHPSSGDSCILRHADRRLHFDHDRDTAVIVMKKGNLALPEQPMDFMPEGNHLLVGNEVGWLGFPAVASGTMCFFSGRVSAWFENDSAYYIDGVSINGVSGGPTFAVLGDSGESILLIGVVSAYIPNVATGQALPGLSVVRDVKPFQEMVKTFRSFEEAAENQEPPRPPEGEQVSTRTRR